MNDIIKGLVNLRPVTLSGVAKTSMLSQHNLMPENGGKGIKKMKYSIDKSSGALVLTGAGVNGGGVINDYVTYNGDGSGDKKYVFDSMVVKTPGDILAAYRKDDAGALQPYALQLDLIYHLDKDSRTFLIVKVPICVTSGWESGRNGGGSDELKYQQFFQELVGKIGEGGGSGSGTGTVDIETKDLTLSDLYPLHGELDKEEMTFFTYDQPNMRKEGVGDIENLHVIVFKNHLELDCDKVANRLVKAVLGFRMGTCDANMDEDHQMCVQVDFSSKFGALMKKAAERVGTNSKGVDIFAVSVRLSPEDYKRLTNIEERKRHDDGDGIGVDGEGDGDGDGDGDSDEKEEFQATAEHPFTANMGVGYSVAVGGAILFFVIAIFTFSYVMPSYDSKLGLFENLGTAFGLMGADIAGFVKSVFGMGIGPGLSVMGLQVLQPKIDRSLGETVGRAVRGAAGLNVNRSGTAVGAMEGTGVGDIFNAEVGNVAVGVPAGADEVRREVPEGTVIEGSRRVVKGVKRLSNKALARKRARVERILSAANEMRRMQEAFSSMIP